MGKLTPERAREELAKRTQAAIEAFTAEAYSTNRDGIVHASQLLLCRSKAARVLVGCTPRAGKTRSILWILADNALRTVDTSSLYLGITAEQAARIAWRPWKKMLKQWKIPHENSETQMATTFPTGSVVYFSGAQDVGSGSVYLGDSYAGGVVVLDECQDRPDAVIVPLIEDVIEDRLSDVTDDRPNVGRLICIGSLPKAKGGWFWRQMCEPGLSSGWEHHGWSRLDNPFLKDQDLALERFLKSRNLSEEDEIVQRNWFGEKIWTRGGGRPYRYDSDRNGYAHVQCDWVNGIALRSGRVFASAQWPGYDECLCAIDLGGSDRASIQVASYSRTSEVVQHVFDWTSERDQHFTWGELLEVLAHVRDHYNVVSWVYDSDASKTEHDTLGREYGIPLIAAANKQHMLEQVRRVSDMLQRGVLKVMIGSAVEDDFQRAQWDQRELSKGKWKLAEGPAKVDASEALRYAIGEYWAVLKEKPKTQPTPAETIAAVLNEAPKVALNWGYENDADLTRVIGDEPDYGGRGEDQW